jgi:hypothetical protein
VGPIQTIKRGQIKLTKPANASLTASASQQGAAQYPCDGSFQGDNVFLRMTTNKVTLLPSPSPSDPGYGSKPEQLLNKMRWLNDAVSQPGGRSFGPGVRIRQSGGIACPLSLQDPVSPLPFQAIATPSEEDTQSGSSFPKGNYPTAQWPTGPYHIYSIHYSIAPKDLKL